MAAGVKEVVVVVVGKAVDFWFFILEVNIGWDGLGVYSKGVDVGIEFIFFSLEVVDVLTVAPSNDEF